MPWRTRLPISSSASVMNTCNAPCAYEPTCIRRYKPRRSFYLLEGMEKHILLSILLSQKEGAETGMHPYRRPLPHFRPCVLRRLRVHSISRVKTRAHIVMALLLGDDCPLAESSACLPSSLRAALQGGQTSQGGQLADHKNPG